MSLADLSDVDLARYLEAARLKNSRAPRTWLLPTYTRREAGMMAAAVATDSTIAVTGNCEERFTLMSAIKPFLLLHLLEKLGHDAVFKHIGKRPSDQPFYSIEQLVADGLRPRNPMLNSGAMLLSTYLDGATPREQCAAFLHWLDHHAGTAFSVHEPTLDEMLTGEDGENTRLSELLERAGHVTNARAAFEIYFHICCIAGTVGDLARLGLLLALPKAEISPIHQATATALTLTCGLYEASAEWAVDVGVPCKSGVSGCIVGIVPGQGSLATFTPWLDAGGNPLAGMTMLRAMAQDMNLGLFLS